MWISTFNTFCPQKMNIALYPSVVRPCSFSLQIIYCIQGLVRQRINSSPHKVQFCQLSSGYLVPSTNGSKVQILFESPSYLQNWSHSNFSQKGHTTLFSLSPFGASTVTITHRKMQKHKLSSSKDEEEESDTRWILRLQFSQILHPTVW
jgi:hypothetical protein